MHDVILFPVFFYGGLPLSAKLDIKYVSFVNEITSTSIYQLQMIKWLVCFDRLIQYFKDGNFIEFTLNYSWWVQWGCIKYNKLLHEKIHTHWWNSRGAGHFILCNVFLEMYQKKILRDPVLQWFDDLSKNLSKPQAF